MSSYHIYTQTVADGTATSVVRPSDWNSAHNQVLNLSGNTAGVSSISGTDIVWSGGNNITLSGNGSTLVISGANQSNQSEGWFAAGNTTQNSSTTLDARSLTINGLGGISAGFSNGSIQISGPQTVAQSNQTEGFYAVGNTTQNSSTTLDARTLSIGGRGDITVGYSNGTLQISGTQTNQNISLFALGNTTQNSSTVLNASNLSFNGLGIITAGFSNGSIQLSATVAAQTNQSEGFYAVGNTTQNSSTTLDARTVSFGGRGDITVGYSNGTIQISGAQTNQNISLFALGNTTQNSSTLLNASNLSFNGLGIITAGFSNGSIQLSATVAAQTNQSVGLYAVGNTTQNSSTTLDARTLSFDGLGAATVGYSNGSIQISAPVQTNQTGAIYASSNTTGASSSSTYDARSLSIQFLGAVSGGWSNGTLQVSAAAGAQSNQTEGLYAVGNTTGASSSTTIDARSLSIQGTGGVSVGYSNGSLVISGGAGAAQTNQTIGLYAVGNTTQNSSTTLDARTLSFDFLGAATGGYSNGSIQVSAPVQTNQTEGWYALGNTTQNSSTTLDARTVSIAGRGDITVGFSNGTIQVSGNQTNQSIGFYAVGNTTNNSSTTLDARTVSFTGVGGITVGYSNGSIILSGSQGSGSVLLYSNTTVPAGNTVANTTTPTAFASSYTIPANLLAVGNALRIKLFGVYGTKLATTPTLQIKIKFGSTTILDTGAVTTVGAITNGGWFLEGTIIVDTLGASGTIEAQGFAALSTAATTDANIDLTNTSTITLNTTISQAITAEITWGSADAADTITLREMIIELLQSGSSNGLSAGMSTGGNTVGTTGLVANQLVFAGGNNITLSQSVNGQSATLSISAAAQTNQTEGWYAVGNTTADSSSATIDARSISVQGTGGVSVGMSNGSLVISGGVGGGTRSYYSNFQIDAGGTIGVANGSMWGIPIALGHNLSHDFLRVLNSITLISSSFASTANTTYSYQQAATHTIGIYTRMSGASSNSCSLLFSSTAGWTWSINCAQNSTNNISVSHGLSYPVSNGTSSISFSYAATNSTMQISSTHLTALTGLKLMDLQFQTSMSAADYLMLYGMSTTQTTQATNLSGVKLAYFNYCMTGTSAPIGMMGSAANNSVGYGTGMGFYTSGGNNFDLSQASSQISNHTPIIQLLRIA